MIGAISHTLQVTSRWFGCASDVGFPDITNDTWARYDTIYINPFDSCCYLKEMSSWEARIRAIKQVSQLIPSQASSEHFGRIVG